MEREIGQATLGHFLALACGTTVANAQHEEAKGGDTSEKTVEQNREQGMVRMEE